jgi:NAD(P)-dependent dehydrogenase (short-subunit alcohol dehydrogenase family)
MSDPQRILITGASSGLGRALALEHAAQGHRLLLLARRGDRLLALAEHCRGAGAADIITVRGDVTRRADLDKAAGLAQRHFGGLDVAYANAGYSQAGALASLAAKDWRRQMDVNVGGVLNTLQAVWPLLAASRGRLGVIGSVVSFGSLADSGAYAASKGAVRSLAQVADLEGRPQGLSVTFVAPGFFASEIRLRHAGGKADPAAKEYLPAWLLGDPAVLARRCRRAVQCRRRELVWPLHAKLAVLLFRHLPGLAQALARALGDARLKRRRAVQGR